MDPYFKKASLSNCPVYKYTKEKWSNIHSNNDRYEAKDDFIIIPLYLIGQTNCLLNDKWDQPRLFFSKRKICLEIDFGNKKFHYGINKCDAFKRIINHLDSECSRIKRH